ncbi:hypothetical protein COOONC_08300 [Cooperia oncophora]
MPEIESYAHNGSLPHPEKIINEENAILRDWNPRALVRALCRMNREWKQKEIALSAWKVMLRCPQMRHPPVAELERHWKQLYMRTKEGRLQIFVSERNPNNLYNFKTYHFWSDHCKISIRTKSEML